MVLNIFRANRFIFTVKSGNIQRKIFQLFFGSDGSLYVNLPYYKKTEGIVSVVTLPPHMPPNTQIDLASAGKVASTLVKYSHHPQGKASFSQTGKVSSLVSKQSVPLDSIQGHIFTILFEGLMFFEPINPKRDTGKPKSNRTVLHFNFVGNGLGAVKILGIVVPVGKLPYMIRGKGDSKEAIQTVQTPEGKLLSAFFVAPTKTNPSASSIFVIAIESIDNFNSDRDSVLIFLGGFDESKILRDEAVETKYLSFIYPIDNYEQLGSKLGTIDLK